MKKDFLISLGAGLALTLLVRLTVFTEDSNLLVVFFTLVLSVLSVFCVLKAIQWGMKRT